MGLTDKVAVVTGGGRGIGEAISRQFATNGAKVVIFDPAEYGDKIAKSLCAEGCEVAWKKVDVSDKEAVQASTEWIIQEYQGIDILVNNAGVRPTVPFIDMVLEDWNKVIDINLTGVFNCCSAAIPAMINKGWGRIINISSIAAQQGSTGGHSHYAAAKAGIIGLSKSLARELARHKITVNVIAPGWIDTEGWDGQLDGRRGEFAKKVPLGRLGEPEDVAYLAQFLASEGASYITGATIPINGGLYIA